MSNENTATQKQPAQLSHVPEDTILSDEELKALNASGAPYYTPRFERYSSYSSNIYGESVDRADPRRGK